MRVQHNFGLVENANLVVSKFIESLKKYGFFRIWIKKDYLKFCGLKILDVDQKDTFLQEMH